MVGQELIQELTSTTHGEGVFMSAPRWRIRPRTAPQVRPAIGASTLKVSKFCEATNAKVWVASCAPRLCLAVHRLMMTMVWLCAPGRKQWKPHLEAVLNSSAQPESDAAHGGGRLAKLPLPAL
mgnify:CR=1 FL=1